MFILRSFRKKERKFSSLQQKLAVTLFEYDARAEGIHVSHVPAVPLGPRLASCAILVQPDELMLVRKDQPAVKQNYSMLIRIINVNSLLGRKICGPTRVAAAAAALTACRQVENAH